MSRYTDKLYISDTNSMEYNNNFIITKERNDIKTTDKLEKIKIEKKLYKLDESKIKIYIIYIFHIHQIDIYISTQKSVEMLFI